MVAPARAKATNHIGAIVLKDGNPEFSRQQRARNGAPALGQDDNCLGSYRF
jgi:hypothetical protein